MYAASTGVDWVVRHREVRMALHYVCRLTMRRQALLLPVAEQPAFDDVVVAAQQGPLTAAPESVADGVFRLAANALLRHCSR